MKTPKMLGDGRMRYVCNTFTLSMLPLPAVGEAKCHILVVHALDPARARQWLLEGEFASAVGHEGAADLLSALTGVEIPVQRRQITLQPHDELLVVQVLTRLPEGRVLTGDEMRQMWSEGKVQLLLVCVR